MEVVPRKKERMKGREGGVRGGRTQQQRGLGSALELAEGGAGSTLRWGRLLHGTVCGG